MFDDFRSEHAIEAARPIAGEVENVAKGEIDLTKFVFPVADRSK